MSGNIRICVLGAGGFLGARMIEMGRVHPGLEVVPLLRTFRSMARLSRLGVNVDPVDTSSVEQLVAAFRGATAVVNATTGDWTSALPDVKRFYAACRMAQVGQFIHLSTAAVFGSVADQKIDDDTEPTRANWFLYAREKARAEKYLRAMMGDPAGPNVVVLRPGLIWGPRSGWVTRPASELRTGRAYLANQGAGICNLCHVDNVATYVFKAVQAGAGISGCYNIGDEETVDWRTYYSALAGGLGLPLDRVTPVRQPGPGVSAGRVLEWVKSRRVGYWIIRTLIKSLSPKAKSLIKWYLPWLAGGGVCPPLAREIVIPIKPRVKFTRETWTLHHTARKLNNTKFVRDFGNPVLLTWPEGLAGTLNWLNETGFADT